MRALPEKRAPPDHATTPPSCAQIPKSYTHYAAVALFFFFGFKTLYDGFFKADDVGRGRPVCRSAWCMRGGGDGADVHVGLSMAGHGACCCALVFSDLGLVLGLWPTAWVAAPGSGLAPAVAQRVAHP